MSIIQDMELNLPNDWKYVRLGDVALDFFGGGTPNTSHPEYWNGDIHWTTSAQISDSLYLHQGAKFITAAGLKYSSSQLVSRGNLLIGTRVGVGKVAIPVVDMAISQDLTAMIVDRSKAESEYLLYAIRDPRVQNLFRERSRGTTIKGIPREDVKQIAICLPPLAEQRAIARVLTTVRQAIEATERVIEATRQLKKAMMKHLFTYGPVPVHAVDGVQLKETEIGVMPDYWGLMECDLLCTLITVGIVVKPASHYVKYGVPAFRSFNVQEDQLVPNELVYVSHDENESTLSKTRLQKDDVLVVRTGYPGTSCVVPAKYDGANCIDLVIVRPNKLLVRSGFLSRFFNSSQGKKQAVAAKVGLAQQHLNVGSIKRTLVPVPPIPQQENIAEMLSVADSKLVIEQRRKETLEKLFQSLLANLMTGKVRVPLSEFKLD